MLVFTNSKNKISPTIIGAGCELIGNIKTENTVQVHGSVNGNIDAETVIIAKGAIVTGEIKSNSLFLHGFLDGNAHTKYTHVFTDAKMKGTLYYKLLNIHGNTGLECKLAKSEDNKTTK